MSDDLPEGWVECLAGDIAEIIGGGTPDSHVADNFSTSGGIPWLTPADLGDHEGIYVSRGKRFLTPKGYENSSARLLAKGAVLFSSRAPIGYVAVAANEIATNQGFKSFVCGDGVNPEYIYFYLKYATPLAEGLASGTTFAEISGKSAAMIPLRLAPATEQRRIAAKLETLLARGAACQKRLANVPDLLKRIRHSVLNAACSGRLTADWREQNPHEEVEDNRAPSDAPEVPESWQWKHLSEISELRGGVTKGRRFNGRKTIQLPYLRVANVQDGYLDLEEIKLIEALPEDKDKYALKAGDLLFTEGGDRDKLGRGTVWRGEIPNCIHQNHIFRARLATKELTSDYVSFATKSDFSRRYFFENASQTVNLASINLTMLGALPVAIPPPAEQKEIVRRVQALFSFAGQIEVRYGKAQAYVDKLIPSLLAKAFRGELVPTEAELAHQERRDYEHASVLLERIQRERRGGPSFTSDEPPPRRAAGRSAQAVRKSKRPLKRQRRRMTTVLPRGSVREKLAKKRPQNAR